MVTPVYTIVLRHVVFFDQHKRQKLTKLFFTTKSQSSNRKMITRQNPQEKQVSKMIPFLLVTSLPKFSVCNSLFQKRECSLFKSFKSAFWNLMRIPDPRCRGSVISAADYSAVRGIGRCYRGMDLGVSGNFRGSWRPSAVSRVILWYAECPTANAVLDNSFPGVLENFTATRTKSAVRGSFRGTANLSIFTWLPCFPSFFLFFFLTWGFFLKSTSS